MGRGKGDLAPKGKGKGTAFYEDQQEHQNIPADDAAWWSNGLRSLTTMSRTNIQHTPSRARANRRARMRRAR
eukprot:4836660-Amphidinium_carterae.1